MTDSDFDPYDGDQYEVQLFLDKQSFVYSVLVTFLQTYKRRELVKEFDGHLSKRHILDIVFFKKQI